MADVLYFCIFVFFRRLLYVSVFLCTLLYMFVCFRLFNCILLNFLECQ